MEGNVVESVYARDLAWRIALKYTLFCLKNHARHVYILTAATVVSFCWKYDAYI